MIERGRLPGRIQIPGRGSYDVDGELIREVAETMNPVDPSSLAKGELADFKWARSKGKDLALINFMERADMSVPRATKVMTPEEMKKLAIWFVPSSYDRTSGLTAGSSATSMRAAEARTKLFQRMVGGKVRAAPGGLGLILASVLGAILPAMLSQSRENKA